jgi:hypothetical protein
MYENHRTTEVPVKPAVKPLSARAERLIAAAKASYILQLAKSA